MKKQTEDILSISGTKLPLGVQENIKLNVGRLPSGTPINLNLHIYRSKNPGPTMLVMGGVHGDEINGVEIVRRAIVNDYFENLQMGSVIAIPLLNIYGFINFSRDTPDGKDVNRSFPGMTTGSLSSRVARTITRKVLPLIDFGVDFHTGGSSRYNYPQVRYSEGDPMGAEIAHAFQAPYMIQKAPLAKSLRKVAMGQKKPIVVFEGGESLRFDGFSIQKGLMGLKRVMQFKGLIKEELPTEDSIKITKTSWLRATSAGIFTWSKQSGQYVTEGEKIGVINDPYGYTEYPIVSKKTGYIIGHNNAPLVSLGDALFHIGYKFSKAK